MLGSVADAEDVVQDAFLRWLDVDRNAVREPAAFLRRVVTRLCLDRLKSVRRGRETYVGPWLPEPVVDSGEDELDDVTLPLLMALERLSPLERAAFLLHDVFSLSFEEVAATIGREPAACRQLASRARAHVRANRPRYPVPRQRGFEIAEAFFAASRDGEMARLRALLAADVTVYTDSGGKVPARRAPVAGLDDVMRQFAAFASVFAVSRSRLLRYGFINGLPGFVTVERGDILQTTALEIADGRIVAVYVVRNPDKLRHMADTLH
jgi:RNA polymerase sigma-70 factor (ECF subfamily)